MRTLLVALVLVGLSAAPAAGAVETCARQSSASFPGAFTRSANLVVGPLSMIGAGRLTDAATVREFGGNKFPVLVRAGHRVRIELSRRARRHASLAYGPLPQGVELRAPRHGHRVVGFRSCSAEDAWSTADGEPVTFWSGFVLTDRPQCLRLRVWVDGERRARKARIALGRRC